MQISEAVAPSKHLLERMHFATFWSFIGIGIFWTGIVGT
jgi:hypothetical protein